MLGKFILPFHFWTFSREYKATLGHATIEHFLEVKGMELIFISIGVDNRGKNYSENQPYGT